MEWLKYLNNQDHMPGKSLKRKSGGTGTDDPDLISGKRPRWECEPGFKSTVKPLILVDELIGNPPPALLVRGQHLIQAKQVKDEEGRPDKPVPEPVCADEEREKLRDRKASDDDEDVGGGADDDDDDDEDDDESVVPDMDVSSRDKSDTSSSQMSSTETSSRETSSAMTSSSDSK